MKKRQILIGILLCGALFTQAADVQSLVVEEKGGSESIHTLNVVQCISFFGTNMIVKKKDATQSTYTTANVQKLLFGLRNASALAVAPISGSTLIVYPNPSSDVLFVKGINASSIVAIYNLSGIVQTASITYLSDGLQLNLSDLPQGLYLLQVNNQTIKIQKQ